MCTAHEINSVVETGTMQICGWRDLPMIQLHGNFTRMTFEPALGQGGLGFYTSPSMWATPSVQCKKKKNPCYALIYYQPKYLEV